MAYVPQSGSVVAFQGTVPFSVLGITIGSVISVNQGSIAAVIVGGSIAATFTPPTNQSVSGTVGASIIGLPPFVLGGSTNASVITVGTAAANQSVSGTVGASLIGLSPVSVSNFPTNQNVSGSVVAFQGTTPWLIGSVYGNISGSVAATIVGTPNVNTAGSVVSFQGGTQVTSLVSTVPSSVMVGASIFGQLPAGTAMMGSVAAYQGAVPWAIAGSVVGFQGGAWSTSVMTNVITSIATVGQVMGSVAALQATNPWNVAGSVAAFQAGTQITSISGTANVSGSVVSFQGTAPWIIASIVGTYAEDIPSTGADKGIFTLGIRNDTVASLVGNDLDYTGWSTDSAGRHLVKPFAAEEAVLRGTGSVNGAASVQLLAAGGTGLKTYLTDVSIANTGAATTLVTFTDGDASIIGRTIAPAGGGSNLPGLNVPMVTMKTNTPINMVAATATSVLYGAAYGYKAP